MHRLQSDPFTVYAAAEKLLSPLIDDTEYENCNRILVQRIKNGDRAARNEIVVRNYRLVRKILSTIAKPGQYNLDDLVQAGMLGIVEAAERFDETYGAGFATYAAWWIRSKILVERRGWRVIHVPANSIHQLKFLLDYQTTYWNEHHHNPTREELARMLARKEHIEAHQCEPTEDQILHRLSRCRDLVSILFEMSLPTADLSGQANNARNDDADTQRESAAIEDREHLNPLDHLLSREELCRHEAIIERIRNVGKTWTLPYRFVLEKRILALPEDQLTHEVIGQLIAEEPGVKKGVSRQRIAQIEKIILHRLSETCGLSRETVLNLPTIIASLTVLVNS